MGLAPLRERLQRQPPELDDALGGYEKIYQYKWVVHLGNRCENPKAATLESMLGKQVQVRSRGDVCLTQQVSKL